MATCFTGPPRLPTFNLLCNVWHGVVPIPPIGAPNIANLPCQLTQGERVVTSLTVGGIGYLLVPKGTDVRDTHQVGGADTVECPAGTGRYYQIFYLDDVGKGFPNEYRQCVVNKVGGWPTPVP